MHPQITPSSGNVFADMGHPHPQKALVKAKLVGRIATVIEERGLTREEAAKLLGMEQPEDVSLVITGRLGDFTIDQLADFYRMCGGFGRLLIQMGGYANQAETVSSMTLSRSQATSALCFGTSELGHP